MVAEKVTHGAERTGSAEGFKLAAEHKFVTSGRTVAVFSARRVAFYRANGKLPFPSNLRNLPPDAQDVNFIVAKTVIIQGSVLVLQGTASCYIELIVIYNAKVKCFRRALRKYTLQIQN
ncbi:hypothetical protein HK096_008704 [Nowakowskiella sp. JEL0078]|nr:hypothetical protein HK096_008704 [Nowakowskiella sp. JEL0078]